MADIPQINLLYNAMTLIDSLSASVTAFSALIEQSNYDTLFENYSELLSSVQLINNFALSESYLDTKNKLDTITLANSKLLRLLNKDLVILDKLTLDVDYSLFSIDDVIIDLYDSNMTFVSTVSSNLNSNTEVNLYTAELFSSPYYLKIRQNADTTDLQENQFVFNKSEKYNGTSSVLYFKESESGALNKRIDYVINNNKLDDAVVYIDRTKKHYIYKYGSYTINNIKNLAVFVYPQLSDAESTFDSISFNKNLFDDNVIELNLIDCDINDISAIYFNDAERHLDTGDMVILDKNKRTKFLFSYENDGTVETRRSNA